MIGGGSGGKIRRTLGRDSMCVCALEGGLNCIGTGHHRSLPGVSCELQGAKNRDLWRTAQDLDQQDPEIQIAGARYVYRQNSCSGPLSVLILRPELL